MTDSHGTFSFMNYLGTLSPLKQDQLYESEWTCQSVLRSLPPVAKHMVLRLLYVDSPQTIESLDKWARIEGTAKHKLALDELFRLRILIDPGSERGSMSGGRTCKLHPTFQHQIRHSITESTPPEAATLPPAALERAPCAAEIDSCTEEHWEALLLYVVGSSPLPPQGLGSSSTQIRPRLHITSLLLKAGLVSRVDGQGEAVAITEAGFQFLLMDMQAQLWVLLKQYVHLAEDDAGVDVGAVMGFLLQMGFQDLRQPYSCTGLAPVQLRVVADLVQLGVLYLHRHGEAHWYYPTKLAGHLTGGLAGQACTSSAEGYIVVETNYRVYAYTASPLALAILRIFTRPDYRLPNLYVGTISMASVRSAISSGISANQIVTFLRHNAHPHVAQRVPAVPETVSDQIRLWEADMNRVQQDHVVMYEDFPSDSSFHIVEQKAKDQGVLLWSNLPSRRIAVPVSAHQGLREFIKQNTRIK